MARPVFVRRKKPRRMARERVDEAEAQIASPHVDERRLVDHVRGRAAQEIAQERQAGLARAGSKRGEAVGTDLGRHAALASMAGAGVVDRDEGSAAQSGLQHLGVLSAERLEPGGQQAHHLAFRNHHADAVQQRQNPLAGHLSLKVQHQDQALKMRAIATDDPGIERRDQSLPIRRLPALAPIAGHQRIQNQVLNDDLFVALVAGTRWRVDLHLDGLRDRQLVQVAAAPLRRPPALGRVRLRIRSVRRLVHPRGFLRRPRRQFLQSRQFVLDRLMLDPQLGQRPAHLLVLRLKAGHFANQSANQADELGRRHALKRITRINGHPQLKSYFPTLDSPLPPGNLPRLRKRRPSL